jgi:5'-deoxynucleotidase YfbR-like HD superfamily hydrolase
VAEHLFSLYYLALYFWKFEDPLGKLNMERVHNIITFHDFGEILNGDIPYHLKTKAHELQEKKDAEIIFNSLPASLKKIAKDRWGDYLKQESKEAKFVYALDKVEPLFELFDPVNEHFLKRLKHSYGKDFEKKFLATQNFPIMRRFVEVISQDMLARKLFWEE